MTYIKWPTGTWFQRRLEYVRLMEMKYYEGREVADERENTRTN
jgi:hypothetical protein